jgi:hypothetical protein
MITQIRLVRLLVSDLHMYSADGATRIGFACLSECFDTFLNSIGCRT